MASSSEPPNVERATLEYLDRELLAWVSQDDGALSWRRLSELVDTLRAALGRPGYPLGGQVQDGDGVWVPKRPGKGAHQEGSDGPS